MVIYSKYLSIFNKPNNARTRIHTVNNKTRIYLYKAVVVLSHTLFIFGEQLKKVTHDLYNHFQPKYCTFYIQAS